MLIKELVRMDELGEFRYDVQLSDYENPKLNLDLLRNYIFTTDAPTTYGASQRNYSAKDVLDLLIRAFSTSVGDYRVVLTANYGHGKSHLALTLANYFAQPPESKQVQLVMQRLEQALSQPSQLQTYRDFKQKKGEFLVVRLQGDQFDDLQEGFLKALEQALKEHPSTQGVELPFWHVSAAKWLEGLSGETRQQAETFLAQQGTDLATLANELRKSGSYELVCETHKHVYGTYPNFGREINLKDLVIWAVNEVCVPKKLGGLLVLFDEFSLFLQKYSSSRTVGKLQELLNGIGDCVGKSAFLAFSQQDVDTVADTYAQGQRLQDVRKELERLPKDKRGRLFSLMESVLAAYLKQDDQNWERWQQEQKVKPFLAQAREIVYLYFGKHYNLDLKWNPEAYTQKVLKGCYPLHPLTTAILAVHNFETGTSENPRTALQFVRNAWEDLSTQPAQISNGRPNFIYPIALVDFFREQISKTWYAAYKNALESPHLTQVTESQRKVLQALFLQAAVAELKPEKDEQLQLLSHLSGLGISDIQPILKDLSEKKIIQVDPIHKMFSLWPASTRPHEVEEIIQKAIEKVSIDQTLLDEIIAQVPSIELSGEAAQFGAQSDWQPRQVLLTAEMLTEQKLKSLLQPFRLGVNGIEKSPRGIVVWLLAQSEQEKLHLRQTAQTLLDKAVGSTPHPLPFVMVLPHSAVPNLLPAMRRLKALDQMDNSGREKIGIVLHQQERATASRDFNIALQELIGGLEGFAYIQRSLNELAVPAPYRASVHAIKKLSLQAVISECYRQAYAFRVNFYTQYALEGKGSIQLRKAVQEVTLGLFSDQIGGIIPTLKHQDIRYQLITDYLENRWGLLSKQTYTVQPPSFDKLKQAWDELEAYFPPGCNEVRASEILIRLLNPPFGYDFHTLTLLFVAWICYHRHEVRLAMGRYLVSVDRIKTVFGEAKTPQEFFDRICVISPLFISRLNPDEIFGEVKGIVERIKQNQPFSIVDAEAALTKLQQAQENPNLPSAIAAEIQSYQPRLQEAFDLAKQYDEQAQGWSEEFQKADFEKKIGLRTAIDQFRFRELVQPTQPTPTELRKRWEETVESQLQVYCARHSTLKDLIDYKESLAKLNSILKELKPYPHFGQQVKEAIEKLNQRKRELEQKEKEKPIRAEIDGMDAHASLAALYQYQKKLTEYHDLTPETEQVRQKKAAEIESRIAQFEQLAEALPNAIERARQREELDRQKTLILSNLELVRDTPLYESLSKQLETLGYLERYFDRLRQLELLPKGSPAELARALQEIDEIETQFSPRLFPAQMEILAQKRQEIEQIRARETQKAQSWLQQIAVRYTQQEPPDELLSQIENPPRFISFLPEQALVNLEKVKLGLKKKIEENTHWQIKSLFKKLSLEARRQVLQELIELLKESEAE